MAGFMINLSNYGIIQKKPAGKPRVRCFMACQELNRLAKISFNGSKYSGKDLRGTDFSGQDLKNSDFSDADLRDTDFTRAKLEGSELINVVIDEKTIFKEADLSFVKMYKTDSEGKRIIPGGLDLSDRDFRGVKLYMSALMGINFRNAKFNKCNMFAAFLPKCDFRGADFTDAILNQAHFDNALMDETTNFTNSNLRSAHLEGVNLTGVKLTNANLINSYIDKNTILTRADLSGAQIYREDNIHGFVRDGYDFSNRNFSNINISNAKLMQNNFNNSQFINSNLSKTLLYGCNLSGANFTGADLQDADMSRVLIDKTTKFRGANLTNVEIKKADLRGTDFTGAKLINTDLSQSVIDGSTIFTGADLSGATISLEDATWNPIIQDLSNRNFSNMRFIGAKLKYNDFSNTNFIDSDLQGAIIYNSNFSHANFTRANLQRTDLRSTNLEGADLSTAIIDKKTEFDGAYYNDQTTKFPPGFDPKAHKMINVNTPNNTSSSGNTASGKSTKNKPHQETEDERICKIVLKITHPDPQRENDIRNLADKILRSNDTAVILGLDIFPDEEPEKLYGILAEIFDPTINKGFPEEVFEKIKKAYENVKAQNPRPVKSQPPKGIEEILATVPEKLKNEARKILEIDSDDPERSYKILGLGRGSTTEDIKQAYRKALKFHPDKNPGMSSEILAIVNAARDELLNLLSGR